MCSDKIRGRKDAGRRNQYKEGSNTQPLMEQQQHQQLQSMLGSQVGTTTLFGTRLQTLKHPSTAAQTLPETSHFCNLPCPQCYWHWSSAAVKKRRRIEHTCIFPCWVRELNLLMEGLVMPQGQDEV